MMLGGPFWSAFLINMGFVGILIEAGSGSAPRFWLIAPVMWFSGYYLFVYSEYGKLEDMRKEFATANAAVSVQFDPVQTPLVIKGEFSPLELLSSYSIQSLVKLPSSNSRKSAKEFVLAPLDYCKRIEKLGSGTPLAIDVHTVWETKSAQSRTASQTVCALSYAIEKPLEGVVAGFARTYTELSQLPVRLETITITHPNGDESLIRYGSARVLNTLPTPVLGCGLNSGGPSWECFHEFYRAHHRLTKELPENLNAKSHYLATALGLKRKKSDQLKPFPKEVIQARIEAAAVQVPN